MQHSRTHCPAAFLQQNASPVWPDVKIKCSLIFSIRSLKSSHSCFHLKWMLFKVSQKVNIYLGNLNRKIRHPKLSEIAQSSHTERNIPELSLRARTTASKHQSYGSAKYFDRGRGGGQVVSLLYLNSNNSSSSPSGVYIF